MHPFSLKTSWKTPVTPFRQKPEFHFYSACTRRYARRAINDTPKQRPNILHRQPPGIGARIVFKIKLLFEKEHPLHPSRGGYKNHCNEKSLCRFDIRGNRSPPSLPK
jgi:hypothetical protein